MTPGDCPNELKTVDVGGVKSYCGPWKRYTNCREAGVCVYEEIGSPADGQMTIFDVLEDECE